MAKLSKNRKNAEEKLGKVFGVKARVEIVETETIPRTVFKANRVINNHDLFKSLISGEEKPAVSIFTKP